MLPPTVLVILDEVGRGTSTFDGVSIARAVAEHICTSKKLGCKTLFRYPLHELIGLEDELEGVKITVLPSTSTEAQSDFSAR